MARSERLMVNLSPETRAFLEERCNSLQISMSSLLNLIINSWIGKQKLILDTEGNVDLDQMIIDDFTSFIKYDGE